MSFNFCDMWLRRPHSISIWIPTVEMIEQPSYLHDGNFYRRSGGPLSLGDFCWKCLRYTMMIVWVSVVNWKSGVRFAVYSHCINIDTSQMATGLFVHQLVRVNIKEITGPLWGESTSGLPYKGQVMRNAFASLLWRHNGRDGKHR